ncbi:MAG: hypothetical protein ACOY0T_22900 [Myxococcota bacterium]
MISKFGLGISLVLSVVGASALAACSSTNDTPREAQVAATQQALESLQAAFPKARVEKAIDGRVKRVYGTAMSTGATPVEAAERFRREQAGALALNAAELVPATASGAVAAVGSAPQPTGLMFDAKTGRYKFLLYRYAQVKGGLAVHRAGLSVLVKNEGNNPVVWASSFAHDLNSFVVPQLAAGAGAADLDKSLRAVRASTDLKGRALLGPNALLNASVPELVIYAGTEDVDAPPRLAIEYTAESQNPPGKWRFVADAQTGDVLRVEDGVLFADVTGTVTGNVTQGDVASDCAPEAPLGFGFAEVTGPNSATTFTDVNGNFTLPNSGTTAIDVASNMGGQYFDVINFVGSTELLSQSVTPPGPASFLHNSANTDPLVLAQSNGYTNSNQIRSFLLKYLPNYPVIATQTNFPVYVNRNDFYCPGNAWYDPSLVTINFCQASATYGNTSFASVNHHEFGHHIVQAGGSGQGAYGEGMGDTVAALYAGVPGLGYGFFLNQCTTALRNAQNNCQYSATSCSSCGSEIHDCGQLISGTFWSIRQALAVTNPETYVDIVNSLALSSIPMHVGTLINSSIAVDVLTLDDNDGNLDNGSPHYAEICSGFQAHGMTCPALKTGLSVSPTAAFDAAGPVGGPFAPESSTYVLSNLGPQSSIDYTVATLAPAPWLSITNATGQLANGQQANVALSINQAVAATLAQGVYSASVQFTNTSDGQGNATRTVNLQVGQPVAIYSEKFDNGLGTFTLGTESTNRWHVTSSCASTQAGHSAPSSLYFGVDSTCNFSTGAATSGTAASSSIAIADTSSVKLRFNYFLQTERSTFYDKAAVLVSVNGGAYTVVASNNSGGVALTDGSGTWNAAEVDLSSMFDGLPSANINVQVSFNSVDSVANTGAGFLVDDIEVRAFASSCTGNAQCNDGLYCNGVESCVNGSCTAGTPVVCNDNVSCTVDTCNEATDSCSFQANDALCSDGQACNGSETCNATTGCQPGTPLNCNDNNACTTDSCDPSGGCQNVAVNCDDGNECTIDSCSTSSGCQHANSTGACTDDGSSCTNDVCSGGVCTHPSNGSCSSPAFQESGGQVVMEGEHFSSTVARASHTWDPLSDGASSGGQVMQANPNNGANINTGYTTGSPQLDYLVNFSTTGTYHVWVRGSGVGTADRTVHAGIDGTGPTSSDRISGFTSTLSWRKSTLDGPVATINVTTPGLHTVNLWMREDGFRVDKIVLTTNASFTPSGAGPAESPRNTGCTSPADCNDNNVCTNDTCTAGVCGHTNNTSPCADDGNSCTNDVCSGGVCTHPNNGSCGNNPCASFCSNPVNFSGNFQSGNLGTAATCHQTTGALNGGNCGNFVSPRTLSVNGTVMTCNNGNWSSIPPKVNGGYCITTTAGNHPWAYFATW